MRDYLTRDLEAGWKVSALVPEGAEVEVSDWIDAICGENIERETPCQV